MNTKQESLWACIGFEHVTYMDFGSGPSKGKGSTSIRLDISPTKADVRERIKELTQGVAKRASQGDLADPCLVIQGYPEKFGISSSEIIRLVKESYAEKCKELNTPNTLSI